MSQPEFHSELDAVSDGYDHIRIHPRAVTTLGRLLCHAARTPFTHPVHGRFASMEGYWQYIRTGCRHPQFKDLFGDKAYSVGLRHLPVKRKDFREQILEGLSCKLNQKAFRDLLVLSDLPFVQYSIDPIFKICIVDPTFQWCLDGITEVRAHLLSLRPSCPRWGFARWQLMEETLAGYKSPIIA